MLIRAKSLYKKIGIAILLTICIFSSPMSVLAAEGNNDYLYTETDVKPAPGSVEVRGEIGGGEDSLSFHKAEDLFATQDYLYIADTGNNRILKLDKNHKLVKEYKDYILEGQSVSFASPSGIFAQEDGTLLIADRDNKRLVRLDKDGNTLMVYGAPQSSLLPETFNYLPSKVVCDQAGRIFVAVSGFNMGLIELGRDGEFVQLLGASKVTYSLMDAFWKLISTKEQQKRMASFVPTEYNNLTVDEEGFLFVTTGTVSDLSLEGLKLVRKLNAKGEDIIKRDSKNPPIGDLIWSSASSIQGPSRIVDCVILSDGNYGILDANRGRVFVYDKFGTLLFEFGGLGQISGTFTSPSSLTYFNDCFYILDTVKNKIQSFSLTEYGETIMEACYFRELNDLEAELAAWNKVYELNNNHPAIMTQLGKIAYRQGDMEKAMYLFEQAENRDDYSRAYQFHRRNQINQYFNVFAITVLSLCVVGKICSMVLKYRRKLYPLVPKKPGPIKYTKHIVFRPLDGFWDLKREGRGDIKVAVGLIIIAGFVKVFESLTTGFIFNSIDFKSYNFLWDLLSVYAPAILWIICSWAVTTLMNGEGSFRDIITATGYALTPLVVVLPCVAIYSNVLTQDEGILVSFFIVVAYLWTAMLLIAGVMETHNYSLQKTIGVIIIVLVVIALVLFLALLGIAVVQQMIVFIIDIKNEIVTRF